MPTLQYDGLITIATGSSRRSASWKTKEMLWSEFVDKLGRVTRTQETQQEYFRMPKEERDNAKDVGGFVAVHRLHNLTDILVKIKGKGVVVIYN